MQPPTPIHDTPVNVTPPMTTPDRRTGLMVFGIITMVLGGMLGMMAVMAPIGALMTAAVPSPSGYQAPPVMWRNILVAILLYLGTAALLIWAGLGSVRLRRWSRPIMLIVYWTWLLSGIAAMAFTAFMLPDMADAMRLAIAQSSSGGPSIDLPDVFIWIIVLFIVAFQLVLGVILPAVFVWFYSQTDVRLTLEHYQPTPDWSDRTPTTVLGVALGLALGAACVPFGLLYPALPLFGHITTGWSAAGIWVALGAMLAVLALGVYRQRTWAWWGTVLLSIVGAASSIITFSQVEFIEMYRHMGMSEQELDMLREYRALSGPLVNVFTAAMTVAWLIFLVAIRKHFGAAALSSTTR